MTSSSPLSLDDDQLELVRAGAEPILYARREDYLRAFAAALPRGEPLTNAAIRQAVSVAQREVLAMAIGSRRRGRHF